MAPGPTTSSASRVEPVSLDALEDTDAPQRMATGLGELDRVLGAGLVSGSAVLVGGDPGIGKSTLALQLAAALSTAGESVLYVAGEEAPRQVRLRAERLGLADSPVSVLGATDVGAVVTAMTSLAPRLAVIDSVQTLATDRVASAPGSVGQLRESTAELLAHARTTGTALLLVGHVTKEGFLAGPRVLEHMVDTVLYFEGDRSHAYRVLRAVKNRFGPTGEIGVFEMRSEGLVEVPNPSAALLEARGREAPGSVVAPVLEGARPVLVEIQALVAPSNPGSARRTTVGVDHGRVAMLTAVMEKHLGLAMIAHDVFVNTAGGLRVVDPGADLAVVAALGSSYLDRPVAADTIVLGEVGLTGELRPVTQTEARLREAARLGFGRAVTPGRSARTAAPRIDGLDVVEADTVAEAWSLLAGDAPKSAT